MLENYAGSYVINLKDEKNKKLLDKFQSNWNYEISDLNVFDAIDTRNDLWKNYKNHLSNKSYKELEKTIKNGYRNKHENLSNGAVGCYLSHMNIWKKLLNEKNDNDYYLIFEADCEFPKNIVKKSNKIIKSINSNWGIVLLGWIATRKFHKFNKHLFEVDRFIELHAYAISKWGAEKLISLHKKIEKHVDYFVSDHSKKIKIYGTKKDLCKQNNFIGSSIQNYHAKGKL